MPIYEFYSPETHTLYSFFAPSTRYSVVVPRCPDGEAFTLQRRVSAFAVTKKRDDAEAVGEGEADDPFAGVDDATMEKVFQEVEGDLGALEDDGDPDPQAFGRVMERMFQVTGKPMPSLMREMLARLKAGDDPDELDDKYGDALEEMDWQEGSGSRAEKLRALAAAMRAPRVDPKLYAITDFVD